MLSVDAITEIRILSAFLGHEHIKWKPSPIDQFSHLEVTEDKPQPESSKPYFHISNLLNIQKEIVVAITGDIGQNKHTGTIIYSTNSKSSPAWNGKNDTISTSVTSNSLSPIDLKRVLWACSNYNFPSSIFQADVL